MRPLSLIVDLLAGCMTVSAQSTAVLQGVIQDPSGAVIPAARVRVENLLTGFRAEMRSARDGKFEIRNTPFHTYTVIIEREGFEPHEETVSLRTNVPQEMIVRLAPAGLRGSITVAAVSPLLVDPEETGTHVQMNQSDIEKLALQAGNKGLESTLVSMPGITQNANGAIHPRGAHNQMTFVIDRMPVSDQLTGAFANAVDPNIVQTVEPFTGNVPAEYGNKVSAVANITTKSGVGTGRRFGGSTLLNAAQFDLLSQVTQAGLQQAIGKRASLKVSCYHKGSKNLQDSKNFLDTGIIFPTTLARIRVNGVEGRLAGTAARGLSLTLSVTHSRAIATPPLTGGLFLGNQAVESFSQGRLSSTMTSRFRSTERSTGTILAARTPPSATGTTTLWWPIPPIRWKWPPILTSTTCFLT